MSEVKKIATRESYGNALAKFGAEYPDLVVLDADLANATKTQTFKNAFPDRFFDCGIAEANMTGIAAGLATCGKIPFISSFAMFAAGRNFEQVRNSIGYPQLNVKIGATHAGITVGEDGATHQCLEDIALMRTIPGMTVIVPADDTEVFAAVKAALDHKGPVYLRFSRAASPVFYDPAELKFEIGKGITLKDGSDLTIIAAGVEVNYSMEAAEMLAKDGIKARVIDMHTIKPLDADLVLKAAAETGKIFTVEEATVIGGLGSAVAELVADKNPVPVHRIGVNDVFGESGPWSELMKKYKLDADGIYEQIKAKL
ncbi:MAG: transketolase family protein [Lachnospiraceae bacterium]|jgi:transketolase|nr:transketolase family protein [Lachnospiraceae bacterium]